MNVDEYRADLEAEVSNDALSFGHGKAATFAEKITALMSEAEYLNGDYQEAFFEGTSPKGYHNKMRVDGYLTDEADNSIVLFVVHYTDGNENMNRTLAEKNFKLLESFADTVLTTELDIEESTATFELAEMLKDSRDEKIKFILLTNARQSNTLRDLKKFFFRGREVECQIRDIERIFAVYGSLQVREPIRIDFKYYGGGLPCLKAANAGDDCESFLCVMPGKVLADIYDEYGSRLLEGNVRSFLSTKRAVNKNMRKTILNQPKKFFAFNNGIATTATQIELRSSAQGLLLTAVVDFQIINGGLTTASLSSARFKDKADLEKIFVQMKLTRIGEMTIDKQEVKKKFPNDELNLLAVWNAQQMPPAFEEIFKAITFDVNNFITGERPVTNVTQWCKQAACWERMKTSLRVDLPANFSRYMTDKKSLKAERDDSAVTQEISIEVDAQKKILSFSGATWRKIFDDAAARRLIASASEKSALSAAMKLPLKPPNPVQCKMLLRLLDRLEENGLTYAADAGYSDA